MDTTDVVLDQQPQRTDATDVAETSTTAEETATAPRRRRREYAVSVDDEKIELKKAHRIAKNMFVAGCFLLPLFWLVNCWLFWPYVRRKRRDAHIEKYARRSLIGFVILTPIAFTWFLVYSAGYDRVFSEEFVRKIDASRLNLKDIGWTF